MSRILVLLGTLSILFSVLVNSKYQSVIVSFLTIVCAIVGIYTLGFGVQGCVEKDYEKKYGDLDNLIPAIEVYH